MAFRFALLSPPSRTPLHARPSLTLFFLLTGAFILALVPHIAQLPIWISVAVVGALVVRSFLEFYRLPLPSLTFSSIVAVCLVVGILFQFRTMFGREAGTAFMAGLLAIKFYELRGPRDIAVIIFSSFFVVMSALLYSQALELFIYCLIMMWVLTALLLRMQVGDLPEDRLLRMLQRSGIIIGQAVPLTVLLFFFFPRYAGKFQIVIGDSPLGLTSTVRPGSIAQLAANDSPAMYVRFINGDPPLVDSMYWRGLVLWRYHRGEWTPGMMAEAPDRHPPSPLSGSGLVQQEITVWPHFQKWLFALDVPVDSPANPAESPIWATTRQGDVLQLRNGTLDAKARYTVNSAFFHVDEKPSQNELQAAVQLPGDSPDDDPNDRIDPRVRALADALRKSNPDNQAYLAAVLHYFRHSQFRYTASPGTQTGVDWLPRFLFETKAGFCEHFASAFAILMRLEKVPARLVVGYYGGEYNPYGNIYTVRQSDAHAWDEVWLDAKKSWVRVDPTSLVTPGLEMPTAAAGPGPEGGGDDLAAQVARHQSDLSESILPDWMHRTVQEMQLRREQVEAGWDNLVFSYDPETQSRLAMALGLGRDFRFKLALACFFIIGSGAFLVRYWLKRKEALPPIENLYAVFCRSMARSGVPRSIWEGPLAYTDRVAEAFPEKKDAIRDVGSIVARSRYGVAPMEADAPQLKSLLTLITASQAATSSGHG